MTAVIDALVKRTFAKRWVGVSFWLAVLLADGLAMGQAKKDCQPAKASPEMLQTVKTGDKISAKLRELPKC